MNEVELIQEHSLTTTIDVEKVIDIFVSQQDVKVSSRGTYKKSLRQFFSWVTESGYTMNSLTRTQLVEFKDKLLLIDKKSPLTVGSYLTALRKFYEFTESEKIYPNIAKGLKTPKKLNEFKKEPLLPEQATSLLEYFNGRSLRDFAMVNLLLRTGLRTIEVVRADVGDIQFMGGKRVLMIQGKGHDEKDSFVVLTDKTFEPLNNYLKTRKGVKGAEPLFPSVSNHDMGGRMTTRSVSRIAKEGLRGIGLDSHSYTAHSLRHTTAVSIMRANGTIYDVQKTLRHASPVTSEIYTKTFEKEERLRNSGESMIDNIF